MWCDRMMGLFFMENIRFWCSGGLISIRKQRARINYMHLKPDLDAALQDQDLEKEIATKYAKLKDTYAAKYKGKEDAIVSSRPVSLYMFLIVRLNGSSSSVESPC